MKFKKILLFVLIFSTAYSSHENKESYFQRFSAHKYTKWILGGFIGSFLVGLLYKYRQNKKREQEKKIAKKEQEDREVARKNAALEEKER